MLNYVVCEYVYEVMVRKVKGIVDSMGVIVEFILLMDYNYLIIFNDLVLMVKMLFIVECIVGKENIILVKFVIGVEDFFFYQEQVFGLFMWFGGKLFDVFVVDLLVYYMLEFYVDDLGMKFGV